MKTSLFTAITLLITFTAGAATPGFCPIGKDGKVRPSHGYKVSDVKTSKLKDVYVMVPDEKNPYGGNTITWTVHKDAQGRIVRIESGGEKPSDKLISFEQEKRELESNYQKTAIKKLGDDSKLPSKDSVSKIFSSPEEEPILFGKAIEMYYEGDNCYVSGVKEKLYDPKSKRGLEKSVFSIDRCQSIGELYTQVKKDINECALKTADHNARLTQILNSNGGQITYSPGVGGGGGAPIRSIASIIETGAQINIRSATSLPGLSDVVASKLQKEKDLCQILAPTRSEQGSPAAGPNDGQAAKEQ